MLHEATVTGLKKSETRHRTKKLLEAEFKKRFAVNNSRN